MSEETQGCVFYQLYFIIYSQLKRILKIILPGWFSAEVSSLPGLIFMAMNIMSR